MSKLLICDNNYLKDAQYDITAYNSILKLASSGSGQRINPLDRTNTIIAPYKFNIQFPLPIYCPQNMTYEELCLEKASQLHKLSASLNKKILVMYSGGIDSTTVLIALLQTTDRYDHIVVTINPQSIIENPKFYNNYIRNKLQIVYAEKLFDLFDSSYIVVGGEFNDQLFGADFMRGYITRYGIQKIQEKYTPNHIIRFLIDVGLSNNHATIWFDLINESVRLHSHGCVNSVYDFLWWYNFTNKWQHIFYRSIIFCQNQITSDFLKNYYHQFFIDEKFQLWSMNNPEQKIGNTWHDYKLAAKKFIYSYTKDKDYYDFKCKRGSLYYVMRQRSTPIAINENLEYLYVINNKDYYQPNNSFQ